MKGKSKGFISVILLITMIFSSTVFALPEIKPLKPVLAEGVRFDGTESSWAKEEVEKAFEYKLTYPDIMKNFNREITREEFCTIVVKLYEALTGKEAEAGANPFTDTKNPEILKAYNLKIVYGTSEDKFTTDKNITRQEICVMIYRALDVSIGSLDKSEPKDFNFSDKSKIAEWASDAVKFAYKNETHSPKAKNILCTGCACGWNRAGNR